LYGDCDCGRHTAHSGVAAPSASTSRHDIDSNGHWSADDDALDAAFHFDDRGTAIDLAGTLESDRLASRRDLPSRDANYRLFTSDAEVTVANGAAHVRDLDREERRRHRWGAVLSDRQLRAIGCRNSSSNIGVARPAEGNRGAAAGTVRIRIARPVRASPLRW
jgi:hypothetical protein